MNSCDYVVLQAWMFRLGLSDYEVFVYAIIYGHSQGGAGVFTGNIDTIAKFLEVDRDEIEIAFKSLQAKGLIESVNGITWVKEKEA